MTIPNAKFELTMSKKFLVALATSLVLANGTSTAFASSGSNSDNSGSSTTLPAARNNKNLTSDQKAAQKKLEQDVILFKAELRTYLLKRAEIEKTFKNDMANAGKSFNIALKSANTFAARKVARDAFVTAGNLARQIYQNALNELGAPPAKPGKP